MSYYKESEPINVNDRSNRYRKCAILRDNYNHEVLLATRDIEEIPIKNSDIYHKVKSIEVGRLDLIAHNYYNNSLLWWVLAQANNIYNPFEGMEAGMILRIPTIESLYSYRGILL